MNELTEPKEGTEKNEILKGISNIMKKEKIAEKKKNSQNVEKLIYNLSFFFAVIYLILMLINLDSKDLYLAVGNSMFVIIFLFVGIGGSLKFQTDKSIRKSEKRIKKLLKEDRP